MLHRVLPLHNTFGYPLQIDHHHQTLTMSSRRHRSSIEDPLPLNLTIDILSRLPVKTIIQCKSVCKKWHDLISDPYFIHLHLSRSPETLIMHQDLSFEWPGSLNWVETISEPNPEHETDYQIVPVKKLHLCRCPPLLAGYLVLQQGSVNGLVCVCQRNDAIYIFNPVLEEFIYIPPPRRLLGTISYGFGVSRTGEYKVIRVSVNPHDRVYEISVYTLGTGKWRLLGQKRPYVHKWIQDVDPGVFVDGHLYWLLPDAEIYDFDLVTETFELFPSPPRGRRELGLMLGVLKGGLSRIAWFKLGLEVWVMKEGSWCKEIAIREVVSRVVMWSDESEPLCLVDGLKGNSVLMVHNSKTKKVVACCLDTNKILNLDLRGEFSSFALTYRPSFVKLDDFGSERVYVMQEEGMCPALDAFKESAEDSDELHESTATTELVGCRDGERDGYDSALERGEIGQDLSCGENASADQADESEDFSDLESEMFDSDDEMFDFDDSDNEADDHDDIAVLKKLFWPCSYGEDQDDERVVDGSKDAENGEGKENVTSDAGGNAK